MRGGADPGYCRFHHRVIGVVVIGRMSERRTGPYPTRVTLALRIPANQQSARRIGVSTPFGAVSTRENSILVPGVSDFYIYERMNEPGMGPYPPRVALALRAAANQRSARGIGVSTPCGAVLTRENSIFVPQLSEW